MSGSAELGVRTAFESGRDRGRRGLADVRHFVGHAFANVGRRWRQSLQLRVVTTTMLLGLFVVSILGGVLHE